MMKLQNELLIRLITDATLALALTAAIVITNLALPIRDYSSIQKYKKVEGSIVFSIIG